MRNVEKGGKAKQILVRSSKKDSRWTPEPARSRYQLRPQPNTHRKVPHFMVVNLKTLKVEQT